MKLLYYFIFGIFGLMGTWFVLTSLLGKFNLWDLNQLQAKAVLIIAALSAGRVLFWAYQLGEIQGKYLQGIGVIILAVLLFQGIIFLGAILFSKRSLKFFKMNS
jgi:hypothetical protein